MKLLNFDTFNDYFAVNSKVEFVFICVIHFRCFEFHKVEYSSINSMGL